MDLIESGDAVEWNEMEMKGEKSSIPRLFLYSLCHDVMSVYYFVLYFVPTKRRE